MSAIFGLIATPMGYVMEFIYNILENYGYSIIAFALLAKVLMLPLSIKQKNSMIATQRLNPKLKEIQKKYANDKEKLSIETQRLYNDYGASPMGSCGTMLLTLPITLGLYYVVTTPLTYFMHLTPDEITAIAEVLGVATSKFGYQLTMAGMMGEAMDAIKAVCANAYAIDFTFYGLNLAATPSFKQFSTLWIFPLLSGFTSWGQSQTMNAMNMAVTGPAKDGDDEKMQQMNKSMNLMMPLMMAYFSFIMPAAVSVYWIANNLFGCVQEVILTKRALDKEKKDQDLYKNGQPRRTKE